jgi:hypothetical protein
MRGLDASPGRCTGTVVVFAGRLGRLLFPATAEFELLDVQPMILVVYCLLESKK